MTDDASKARLAYARAYREANRARIRAYDRAYYAAHRERRKAQQSEYWERKAATGIDQPERAEDGAVNK